MSICSTAPQRDGTPSIKRAAQNEPLAYSVDAACRAISCGRTWLYARIKSGELQAVRIHGRTLIPATSLRRLIEGEA
jgi:Helix-turn-helix domain